MTTNHTPGPWTYDSGHTRYIGTSRGVIAKMADSIGAAGIGHNIPAQENEANARLIAAAPDMLAALRGIAESLGDFMDFGSGDFQYESPGRYEDFQDEITKIRAAIAKAEGR